MPTTTWNSNDKHANLSLSNGNLTATNTTATGWCLGRASKPRASGKWYFETLIATAIDVNNIVGIARFLTAKNTHPGLDAASYSYFGGSGGRKYYNGSYSAYGSTFGAGDVIGVALDLSAKKIWFSKNGAWQSGGDPVAGTGEAFSGLIGAYHPVASIYATGSALTGRFAAASLSYSPPSGFVAWDDDSAVVESDYKFSSDLKSASISLADDNRRAYVASGGTELLAMAAQPIMQDTYFEFSVSNLTGSNRMTVGLMADMATTTSNVGPGNWSPGCGYVCTGSILFNGSSDVAFGPSYATGDVIGVAYEFSTGKIWFSKNGVWLDGGNPAGKTSPARQFSVAGIAVYPAISATTTGNGVTLRVKRANYSYAMPYGYASYVGESDSAANWLFAPKFPILDRSRSALIINRA